jgi:hypothetical protein
LQFHLNCPSRCARYVLLHAYTGCLPTRPHPADASAAWRPSPHMAVEPRPHPGAPAGAAAGPAGRAVAAPYAAAAALSNAPGIRGREAAGRLRLELSPARPSASAFSKCKMTDVAPRQTTPPHGAMQRGRRRRGKSGGPPRPREQIRLRHCPVSAGKLPGEFVSSDVEPFSFRPDKTLPGTLHHSGNRPAPPSDHTPLARRSAFRGLKRRQCGNSDARTGLERIPRENLCRADARQLPADGKWNFVVSLPLLRRSARNFLSHKSVEYTLTRSEIPGVLAVIIST